VVLHRGRGLTTESCCLCNEILRGQGRKLKQIIIAIFFGVSTMTTREEDEYAVCSDLPKMPPLYSCSACDSWRERIHTVHFREKMKIDRASLSVRYQCNCAMKGYGPIKKSVVYDPAKVTDSSATVDANPVTKKSTRARMLKEVDSNVAAMPKVKKARVYGAGKRAAAVLMKLEESKVVQLEQRRTSELSAKDVREKELVSELDASKKQLKSAQSMLNHYNQRVTFEEGVKGCKDADLALLCCNIEKVISLCLPGKHNKSKAAALMNVMENGMLFNGEC
jgi:hypothetical protein